MKFVKLLLWRVQNTRRCICLNNSGLRARDAVLVVSEVVYYMGVEQRQELFVDTTCWHKLNISLDLMFHRWACERASHCWKPTWHCHSRSPHCSRSLQFEWNCVASPYPKCLRFPRRVRSDFDRRNRREWRAAARYRARYLQAAVRPLGQPNLRDKKESSLPSLFEFGIDPLQHFENCLSPFNLKCVFFRIY